VNRSIARLFVVVILLFAILIVWTSRWTVFSATTLQNNPRNQLSFYASLKVKRGRILADNRQVLAKSTKARGGTWNRKYPDGPLFSQAIGYAIPTLNSSAGLEQYLAPQLSGAVKTGLSDVFGRLSTPSAGNDVYTTLDPTAQALAQKLLEGRVGSVVAIVPQTGAVKVMYSNPTYNNNDPSACQTTPNCSQFINATEGRYPPGSTFKLITTAAALNSGEYTPDSEINGDQPLMVSGQPLHNDGNESWGDISLTTALTNSVNTVFAQVGQDVGASTMEDYMKRFGFYAIPPLDFPAGQMAASGELVYGKHSAKLIEPTDPRVDIGRMSIGQDKLGVTPLQMAMVVSAIANDGKLMQPRLTNRIVNQNGQVVETRKPREEDRVIKPNVADEMQQMMRQVVEEGTGESANLEGLDIAGKTGTASTGGYKDGQPLDDAWFVGFPVSDPKIAVAVELSDIPNGYGGTYAAPIAAQVIKTLLAEGQ
jgi:peptidoglycan glycosyltransferase